MLIKFRNNFITGLVIILPLAITIIIMRYMFLTVNSFILNPIALILRWIPLLQEHSVIIAKMLVFLIVILLISFAGWAANVIFLRKLFGAGEKLFRKIPMVGKIYSVTKEIGAAFFGKEKTFFKKVVLVEYPRKGIYSLGFLTGEGKGEVEKRTGRELTGIFVPTAPNPTTGMFIWVPKEEVVFLDMSIEEGFKIVISSGAITAPARNSG